ncbi:NUDIX domain-containing protein [Haloarcula sp. 1CSR25-25]|uniref:NUDIX hydrolase n=1 Tax=Haloarcula sp. 1CSR25-25 TaxID=2862545 RepID=UPI002895D5F2|nr:NUDIX domain-containing protein [Haloarcula sp. 1CSR25-25]MDT3435115.1 NUDIX domain-containing protein [Haloarcula sp. 1CSR25-25]
MTDGADDPGAGETNLTERINQTNVEQRISSLEAAYDEVPVSEETFELSPEEYADVFAATRGTGYSGNSVVFVTRDGTDFPELSDQIPEQAADDTRDRVLLVLGRGADVWALPGGGKGDEYESVQGTAVRRVNEQTGIRCTVTGVAEVVHSKYYPDTDAQGSVHTLDTYLRAEYRKGALDVDESELVGAAWFAEPPERLTPGAEERFGAFLDSE